MQSKKLHTAYIAVGSNLGDRVQGCRLGVEILTSAGDIVLTGHSGYYFSEPVGFSEQPWFVNAVFSVKTGLDPFGLLDRMRQTESGAGRKRGGIRFGPRVLDLDLIFYDDRVIRSRKLTVPHPRMHLRSFVLIPLCDLDPDMVHPVLGRTVGELAADTEAETGKCYLMDDKVIDKTAPA